MDETEIKNTEFKNLKYLSLAPQSSPDYEASSKLLYEKIKDDSVYNIGIIAQYGAGKSSLIKTFKDIYENKQGKSTQSKSIGENEQNDKREKKTKIKTLNISLANFNVDVKQTKQCNDIDQAVEKSILQQMLYKKEKNDLPKSQIKRIKSFSLKRFFSIIGLFLLVSVAILSLTFLGMSLNGNPILTFKYADILCGVFGFILLALFAGGLFQFIEVSSIKFKDLELSIEKENCEKDSLLNKFLNEVIYYFQKTKYNVVIFEDLDRFNNLNIFVKLRELNTILNSNQKLNKKGKITFVYAVRNDMFGNAEERSKFFDFIISVFPILSPINASSKIIEGLKECGFEKGWLKDEYINDISNYIDDMRILNSTINDCIQLVNNIDLHKINGKDLQRKNMNVFSLMAYKNISPKAFADLEDRKGELCDIINRVSTRREEYIKRLTEKIDDNNKYLEELNRIIELNEKDLLLLIKGALLEIGKKASSSKGTLLGDEIDFNNEDTVVCMLVTKYNTYAYNTQSEYAYATIKQINDYIQGLTIAERYDAFVNFNKSVIDKRETLIRQNKKIQHDIDNYERNDYEFIKKYPNEVFNSTDSPFLRMLLGNGYLDENFRDYLSKSGDSFMAENDRLFIRRVVQNEPPRFDDLKLTSPAVICEKLSIDKFDRLAILNVDFINYMFANNCLFNDKKSMIKKLIKSNIEDVTKFIIHYFNVCIKCSIEFVKCLMERRDLLNIIKSSGINDKKIDELLIFVMNRMGVDTIQEQSDLPYMIGRLEINEKFNADIANYSDKQLHFLQCNSYRIGNLSKFNFTKNSLIIIEKYCMWELNVDNYAYLLLNLYNLPIEEIKTKGYSVVRNLNENIRDYILENISYYIQKIMLIVDVVDLEMDDFIFLLKNDNIEIDNKYEIIGKQKNKVDYFDCEDEILKCLLDHDKVFIELDQLIDAIETAGTLSDSAIEFLVRNKGQYVDWEITSEKAIYAIANYNNDENICILENLFDLIEIKKWDMTLIHNDKSLAFLVKNIDEINRAEIDYISEHDFIEAQKQLACLHIDSLIEDNRINSVLAKTYIKYGGNIDSRIKLYQLEELELVDDFASAEKILDDLLHDPVKISDRLYNQLMTMKIDRKLLFVNQLEFMKGDVVWKRLPLVEARYSELVESGKISIDKSDIVLEALYRMKLLRKSKKNYLIVS